jgi:hypothetical protein
MLYLPLERMTMHPHKPDALLTGSGGIPALMPQARRLLELRRILADLLPEVLARSCTVANYKLGKLVILAESSAIAAKLKLLSPQLCERLSRRGVEVTGMNIGVQAPEVSRKKPLKLAELSDQAAEALARLSSQLPESKLKSSVEQIRNRKVGKR